MDVNFKQFACGFLRSHSDLIPLAKDVGCGLSIFVFKNERKVELRAKGWNAPRVYAMTGFSGVFGPKLKEGEGRLHADRGCEH